jgi:tetratricopeptide (TPR) repeat protein
MQSNKSSSKTFKLIGISLFLISFNAYSLDIIEKQVECNVALNNGKADVALKVANELIKADANNHDGYICRGRALGMQGNYADALISLEKATTNVDSGFNAMINYLLIGNLHKVNKKYPEAIANYEKSAKICDSIQNNKFKRINITLIGESHAENNDINAALASYLEAVKFANNDNERADNFERLGSTYDTLGKHDLAIEYQLKAVLMQRKAGSLDQYANANLELGRIYLAAKEYANAEKYYAEVVKFAKENGGAYYEARANVGLANTKAASGDAATAKVLLADAQNQAKSVGAADLNAEIESAIKNLAK